MLNIRLLLILFITFNFVKLHAICRKDTIYYYKFDSDSSEKKISVVSYNTYNALNKISETYEKVWNINGFFIDYGIYKYYYDSKGNLTDYYTKFWHYSTSEWINHKQYHYEYDDSNNIILELNQIWDNDKKTWININKLISIYNSKNLIVEIINQQYNVNVFENYGKSEYYYDKKNNLIQDVGYEWNIQDLKWEKDLKNTHNYGSKDFNKIDSFFLWNKNTNKWDNYYVNKIKFDSINKIDIVYSYNKQNDNDSFIFKSKKILTPDLNNNIIREEIWIYDNTTNTWLLVDIKKFEYNQWNDLIAKETLENWDRNNKVFLKHYREEYFCNYDLNIKKTNVEELINTYPNPCTEGFINIKIGVSTSFQLIDISGKIITQGNLFEGINTIDINEINNGFYFLKIKNNYIKIVIEK